MDREFTDHVVSLCQALIRIDTTNPPGNERPAAELLATELAAAGLEPVVLESAPTRANVVTRLKGTGEQPPLLLTAHLDVVEADPERWEHSPFSGEIIDGCLWGRGAIDMKNHAAMSVALMTRLAREKLPLTRDLIFAGVADEEAGCQYGSQWLCDHHPDLVRAAFAIGEGGGFNIHLAGRTFFTIQVAEKGVCWVRARATGEPGHGSMPRSDSAVLKLSRALARLGERGLPQHRTAVVEDFVRSLVADRPGLIRGGISRLLHPKIAPHILKLLPDPSVRRGFQAMLGNTASPTVLRAGNKTNVIPATAEVEIDGRTLPGQTSEDFMRELSAVLGPDVELEVIREAPPIVTEPRESPLYDVMTSVLHEREPDALVAPYMLPGFTDAKAFTQLGMRWYGFAPVKLPPGLRFADLFHGHDERIPVDGLRWGAETLAAVVTRFCR